MHFIKYQEGVPPKVMTASGNGGIVRNDIGPYEIVPFQTLVQRLGRHGFSGLGTRNEYRIVQYKSAGDLAFPHVVEQLDGPTPLRLFR